MSEDSRLRDQKGQSTKRFYKEVTTVPQDDGVAVLLDGKLIRTPAKAMLAVPSQALADAIAEEWLAQDERINPESMRLTKLANIAIDGVRGREAAVLDDLIAFAGSDLLCYRADAPEGLIAKQNEHWDSVLTWAKQELGAPFRLAQGVGHVAQPQASLDAIKERLEDFDAFSLAALHVMTTLTGSALLALAVALRRLTPDEAWALAHVDEDWQIGQWGEDVEATARRERRRQEFDAATNTLRLSACR
jgi:chaperone required for assembly of F1-ATPase